MVVQETLRFQNPAQNNSAVSLLKDTRLGKYQCKAGTQFIVDIESLHHNPTQWQRPKEFLPQRFNHTDPLFLTPDGKKRHSHAFAPFNGGKRVCFGKTFAEVKLKMMAIYLTQYFNFEHVDAKYREKDTYHISHLFSSGQKDPIIVKLTPYNPNY